MITQKDFRWMQDAADSVLEGREYLGKALSEVMRQRRFDQEERAFIRDLLYASVQLKNRYRTVVVRFTEAFPEKEDYPLDLRFFFVTRFFEHRQKLPIEKNVYAMLYDKARIRRFVHFLKTTPPREIFPREREEDPAFLWLYHSHPLWMVRKWVGLYGYGQTQRLCSFNNQPPDSHLRVNPNQGSRDELVALLREEGVEAGPSALSPFCVEVPADFDPLRHSAYREGKFTLQNVTSQLVCLWANPKPGEKVLDFCAGEGGKTLTLSHLMKGKGEIHVHDAEPWRLESLQKRARKEGVGNIRMANLDWEGGSRSFDMVLVDAPCSGSGQLRHRPEIKWRLQQKELEKFNLLQLGILDAAANHTRPGGLMLYVTCSLFQEENHKVVRRFLGSREGWELVTPERFLAERHSRGFWVEAETLRRFCDDSYLQFLPQRDSLPGMFCAVLRRKG